MTKRACSFASLGLSNSRLFAHLAVKARFLPTGVAGMKPQVPSRELPMPSLLVIDDDPTVLQVFRKVFDQTDAILHTASAATDAMQMLARHQVDAVLLDVML